jgi:hypothetical protein
VQSAVKLNLHNKYIELPVGQNSKINRPKPEVEKYQSVKTRLK